MEGVNNIVPLVYTQGMKIWGVVELPDHQGVLSIL